MPKKILIAPLEWGLGHTSRCVPLAQHYHSQGYDIFFAGNQIQQQLFKAACPFVRLLDLEGYGVVYPKKAAAFIVKIASQIPKIQQAVNREHRWLRRQMREHQFDVILSDNRYGMYHKDAFCVLLTHQLHIQTNSGLGDRVLKQINKQFINKFDECWVVDNQQSLLAGKLSHPIGLKIPYRYIGWLSQFQFKKHTSSPPLSGKNYTLAVLSGPEPMRTQLQMALLHIMQRYPSTQFVMIGGTNKKRPQTPENVHYIPLATSEQLYPFIQHCDYLISRCGYSTVMDVLYLQKPALFVPTPGQTEQELIGELLHNKEGFLVVGQEALKDIQQPSAFGLEMVYESHIPELP